MDVMVPQLTGVSMVCATVCLGVDHRKHESSWSLEFTGDWLIPLTKAYNTENVSIW